MQDNLIFVKKPEKCKKMYVYEENWRSHRSLCVIKWCLYDGLRGKVSKSLDKGYHKLFKLFVQEEK